MHNDIESCTIVRTNTKYPKHISKLYEWRALRTFIKVYLQSFSFVTAPDGYTETAGGTVPPPGLPAPLRDRILGRKCSKILIISFWYLECMYTTLFMHVYHTRATVRALAGHGSRRIFPELAIYWRVTPYLPTWSSNIWRSINLTGGTPIPYEVNLPAQCVIIYECVSRLIIIAYDS